jgi:hypothetical protein
MSVELARNGIKKLIAINPISGLTIKNYPLIDNGFGEMIPDLANPPVETILSNPVRIAKQKPRIQAYLTGEAGPYSLEIVYYLISDYETITGISEGAFFESGGKKWRLKRPDPLEFLSNIIGYQTELIEITETVIKDNTA